MPELPEVEVTRRGIAPALVNKCISHFVVRFPCLRTPVSPEFSTLENLSVVSVNRRGKYIIIKTDSGSVLIHLGMSGHLHLEAGLFRRHRLHLESLRTDDADLFLFALFRLLAH